MKTTNAPEKEIPSAHLASSCSQTSVPASPGQEAVKGKGSRRGPSVRKERRAQRAGLALVLALGGNGARFSCFITSCDIASLLCG